MVLSFIIYAIQLSIFVLFLVENLTLNPKSFVDLPVRLLESDSVQYSVHLIYLSVSLTIIAVSTLEVWSLNTMSLGCIRFIGECVQFN